MAGKTVLGSLAIGAAAAAALLAGSPSGTNSAQARQVTVLPRAPLGAATVFLPPQVETEGGRVDYARLDGDIREVMSHPDMVGLAVAVVEDGRITFARGYGETAAGTGDPVRADTVFRWASLSKGVAATTVAKLAEQGRLSLAAPIASFGTTLRLPGGAERFATVEELLSHRLGLTHNALDNRLERGEDPKTLRQALSAVVPRCAPGQCHTYQNVAYDDASEIVQAVTGRRYQSVVEQLLFQPLGMTSASLTRAGLVSARSWARPHIGRRTMTVNDNYYRVPAAGGVNSSVLDLARWMQAQMGEAPDVVSPSVLSVIHLPRTMTDRHLGLFNRAMGPSQYALGWRDYDYHGHRLVGHQGAVMGYRSAIVFDPVRRSGIAMLWNAQTGRPIGLQLGVLDQFFGLPRTDWLNVAAGAVPRGAGVGGLAAASLPTTSASPEE